MKHITAVSLLVCLACYALILAFPPPAWASTCDGFGAAFNREGPMVMDQWSCYWNQVWIRAVGQRGPGCCPVLIGCFGYDPVSTAVDNSNQVTSQQGEICILDVYPQVEVDHGHSSLVTWRFFQGGPFPPIDISHNFVCP